MHTARYRKFAGMTHWPCCMTMLGFRVDDVDANEAQVWATRLGLDRSELLREARHGHGHGHRHLLRLASEQDAETWLRNPLTDEEHSLTAIEDWGPAED